MYIHPIKTLPRHYEVHNTINLSKNRWLAIGLNIGSIVFFFIFGWFFWNLATFFYPNLRDVFAQMMQPDPLTLFLIFAFFLTIQIILHELTHGLFFWLFTKERPRFSLKWLQTYAYATAPENCYLTRNQYVIALLAPFVLITFLGLILLAVLSQEVLPALLFVVTSNAAGAIGDLFIIGWLLYQPATALVRDITVAMIVYRPKEAIKSLN
jgi:hypothetical protein